MSDFDSMRRMLDDFRSMSDIMERNRDVLGIQEQLEPFKEVQRLVDQAARETQALVAVSSRELSSRAELMASGFSGYERSLVDSWSGARYAALLGEEVFRDSLQLKSTLSATHQIDKISSAAHDVLAGFERAAGSVSPIIAMMGDAAKSSFNGGYLDPALTAGFGNELLAIMVQAGQIDDEEEIADFMAVFLAWLLEQARRLRGLVLTPAVIWHIFGTVLQILLSQIQASSANQQLMEEIRSAKEEIILELRANAPSSPVSDVPPASTQRVVVEETVLLTQPSEDADRLRLLPLHLVVQEVRQVDDWTFVHFFDYVQGTFGEGWVESSALESVESSEEDSEEFEEPVAPDETEEPEE